MNKYSLCGLWNEHKKWKQQHANATHTHTQKKRKKIKRNTNIKGLRNKRYALAVVVWSTQLQVSGTVHGRPLFNQQTALNRLRCVALVCFFTHHMCRAGVLLHSFEYDSKFCRLFTICCFRTPALYSNAVRRDSVEVKWKSCFASPRESISGKQVECAQFLLPAYNLRTKWYKLWWFFLYSLAISKCLLIHNIKEIFNFKINGWNSFYYVCLVCVCVCAEWIFFLVMAAFFCRTSFITATKCVTQVSHAERMDGSFNCADNMNFTWQT